MQRVTIFVRGRVQGVGFRWWTRARALELGLIGLFGFSVLTWLFGSWHFVAYDIIGVSAVWQITRQRLFG